eukprot:1508180-Pyramimonas_sp.AAC.1
MRLTRTDEETKRSMQARLRRRKQPWQKIRRRTVLGNVVLGDGGPSTSDVGAAEALGSFWGKEFAAPEIDSSKWQEIAEHIRTLREPIAQ